MTTIFITLLNMSVTAGVTALAVMLARAAFKKLPKRLTCALWALVGLRLAIPFQWESALSLIPRASTVRETVGQFTETAGTASPAPVAGSTEYFAVSNFIPPTPVSVPAAKPFDWLSLFTAIWLVGAAAMLCFLIVSALLLKRRVGACVETEPGVFVADGLASPFVLGVFRPKIYLPPSLKAAQKEMILAHERAHLKRRDHLIKPFAFLLLAVYWFNPVLWVAYALLCRDIELACDERVIRDMDKENRAFYSQTLLDCGSRHRRVAACPVAFGEVGVKERVKNVLNYKKPAFWIILIAVIAGIVLAVCFLTNPKTKEDRLTGVRLTMSDMLETTRCYDITESGELVEAEYYTVGDSTRYNAASDCFSYDVEEGKLKTRLVKTELTDGTQTAVEITDAHRAIFEAVERLDRYIVGMSIFESHRGDDRYFVAVAYQEDMDTFCDVFQFNASKGSLKKLCRIAAMPGTVFVAADVTMTDGVKDASLDARIFTALREQSAGKYLEGECYAEAHHIYGTEEKDGKTVVYALVRECWFGFVNDYFTEVSGSQCPLVFTFDGDDCEIERALDGGMFEESVKTLFPTQYADEILKHGDRYNDKLWNELVKQAKDYLKSIGRTATVCKTSEAGLSTLSAHGVPVEVSNILINMPLLADYPFYGTQEKLEDGVRYVYSTKYDATTNRIIYQKSEKGESPARPTQEIVIDAATGEIVSNYTAPVEQGKDAQTDVDWIEAAKIDERTIDIDGDGVEDRCVMSYGPTSGLFTFYLTVTPAGASAPKYQNIFWTDWSELSFPYVQSAPTALYVRAADPLNENEAKTYMVLIENGELVLRGEDGDMPRWAGEAEALDKQTVKPAAQSAYPVGTISSINFDVDGDGKKESCDLSYGPLADPFTVMFTAFPYQDGASSYVNIFQSEYKDLRFETKDGKLFVKASDHQTDPGKTDRYEVSVKDGMLVLRGGNDSMAYWGGQKGDLLERQWTARAYPELFSLDASKGLDVYIWLIGKDSYHCWLTERGAYDANDAQSNTPLFTVILDHFSDLTPENMRDILAFYDIPAKKVNVIPCQHPLSSYLWIDNGKIIDNSVTEKDLREMLGL